MKIAEQKTKIAASLLRLNLFINVMEQEAAVNPEVHAVREDMIDGCNKGEEMIGKLTALVEKLGEEKADEVFLRIQQAQDTSVDFEQYHANIVKALDNEINSYDGDSNG